MQRTAYSIACASYSPSSLPLKISKPQQLASQLERGLAPVYLICGEEPLQLVEAAQVVRDRARALGYEEREVLDQEGGFDWNRLAASSQALSLFSTRKLIDLRLPSARIGREGSAAICAYCEQPQDDNRLLITAPALEWQELKTRWVQTVERTGVLMQVWPLTGRALAEWIEARMHARGLTTDPEVASLLTERIEGNLLAAAQEIDKLALLYGRGQVTHDQMIAAISDSARFDVFDLTDAVLAGDRARCARVLDALEAEDVAPALVLWALARELRMLAAARFATDQGGAQALGQVLDAHRVRQARRPHVARALERLELSRLHALIERAAQTDACIKGLTPGDPWLELLCVADALAGGPGVTNETLNVCRP